MSKELATYDQVLAQDELNRDIPDDALSEIAEVAPDLTLQERRYVYWRVVGSTPLDAYKKSGYTGTTWRTVDTRPRVRDALASMHERIEPEWRVTQKTVVGILFEAIDIARRKDQAGNLIEAATALANITGVGAASKLQIQQDTQINITNSQQSLRHVPRAELEDMLDIKRVLPYEIRVLEHES
jgi:hypothetical protein